MQKYVITSNYNVCGVDSSEIPALQNKHEIKEMPDHSCCWDTPERAGVCANFLKRNQL